MLWAMDAECWVSFWLALGKASLLCNLDFRVASGRCSYGKGKYTRVTFSDASGAMECSGSWPP